MRILLSHRRDGDTPRLKLYQRQAAVPQRCAPAGRQYSPPIGHPIAAGGCDFLPDEGLPPAEQ